MPRRPEEPAPLRSVAERSVREQARSLASWTLGLLVLALALTAVFPTIRGNPALAHLHESYPKALQALFDVSDLSSPVGYVRAEVFSFTAPMLVVVLGVLWGSDLVAGEEDRGTIDLLLANPISRRRVLAEKWVALLVGVAVASAGLGAGLGAGLVAFAMHIPATRVVAAVVATALLGLLFGTVALAIGAATGRRGLARGVAALLAVAAYLASTLAGLVGWLGPARAASPWYHTLGTDPLASGVDPWHFLLVAGMTLAVVAAGLVAFDRRDLGV